MSIDSDVKPKRKHWDRDCGCRCEGCTHPEITNDHCLGDSCARSFNKRSADELNGVERYPNGRIRRNQSKNAIRKSPKLRTPEEIEAAGRYPSGRVRPDRTNWASTPNATIAANAAAGVVRVPIVWFVNASRGATTIRLPAPDGQAQAQVMAQRLCENNWDVNVEGPSES